MKLVLDMSSLRCLKWRERNVSQSLKLKKEGKPENDLRIQNHAQFLIWGLT